MHRALNKRSLILIAMISIAALGLYGCGQSNQSSSGNSSGNAQKTGSPVSTQQTTSSGTTQETTNDTTRGATNEMTHETNSQGASGGSTSANVTLKLAGEPGQKFSGRCTVDGEKRKLRGKTPSTYTYSPERRLECEISSKGGGPLLVRFSDGTGANSTQRVGPGRATMKLTYTGNGLSVTTHSRSGSSQTNSSRMSSSQSSSIHSSSSQSFSQSSAQGSPGAHSGSK